MKLVDHWSSQKRSNPLTLRMIGRTCSLAGSAGLAFALSSHARNSWRSTIVRKLDLVPTPAMPVTFI